MSIDEPTEAEVLTIMAYIIDAIDPRLSVKKRNEILDKAHAIDPILMITLMGGLTAGIVERVSEIVVSPCDRNTFLDRYLAGMRRNTGEADISFITGSD